MFSGSYTPPRQPDLFCCQIQEGAEEKNTTNVYQRERERTLAIINSNRAMTVNREEPVWAAFYSSRPPLYPTTSHLPPPRYLMKYVQGKQRWGWCADLPPPWLTTTRPVPLLIYKASRVSARVASLTSLHDHKGTFKHSVYISSGVRRAITKTDLQLVVKGYGGTV